MLDSAIQDLRLAIRQLAKNKGFTITAISTVALAIGANTAIFTLLHAVMFRSLPVANPAQLYRLGDSDNCCVTGGIQIRRRPPFSRSTLRREQLRPIHPNSRSPNIRLRSSGSRTPSCLEREQHRSNPSPAHRVAPALVTL